jgi:hypothetical protein
MSQTKVKPLDPVNPAHYKNDAGVECIDAIKAQLTTQEFEGFLKGQVAKYVWRERQKGGREDLKKAHWYLSLLVGQDPRVPK